MDFDDLDPEMRCYALVGRFLHAWSKMERSLENAIGAALAKNPKLQEQLTNSLYFPDKVHTINTLVSSDTSFTSDEIVSYFKNFNGLSQYYGYRNIIVHEPFEAHPDGVQFTQTKIKKGELKINTPVWTPDDFQDHIKAMDEYRAFIEQIGARLTAKPLPKRSYDDDNIFWHRWQQSRGASAALMDWLSRQPPQAENPGSPETPE
jgi:hypothetical protein